MSTTPLAARWSSRLGFVLAAVGSAVGLGNIWKFPYAAGSGGGGAFVAVYLAALLLIAAPIFIAETLVGRLGRGSPPTSLVRLARPAGARPFWAGFGYLSLVAVTLVLSFYSVVAGWSLAFVVEAALGGFAGGDPARIGASFNAFLAQPLMLIFWQSLFMVLTVAIVARGVRGGIERAVDVMMPLLFVMLLALVVFAAVEGAFGQAVRYLFAPDFSKLDGPVVLAAIGQAFFTLGIGVGGVMTYGAYLDQRVSIPKATVMVVGADTAVALLAGLAIFPLVFAHGLDPDQGPGLVFVTLPIAFGKMAGGSAMGVLFFLLLAVAAVTSSVAIMTPFVAWLEERGWPRPRAAMAAGGTAWLLGLATVFSFNIWQDWHPLSMIPALAQATVFGIIDYVVTQLILPLGGILLAIFAGWVLGRDDVRAALHLPDGWVFAVWRLTVRVVAPLALTAVLAANLV